MQEHDQSIRASIQNPVVVGAHVATQLAQFSGDLRAVRKRQMRQLIGEKVESVDLAKQSGPALRVEAIDELPNGLGTAGVAVVDRLEVAHAATADADAAVDVLRSAAESFSAASTLGTWWT